MRPAIQASERQWFCQQLARLNEDGAIPYAELLPLWQPFRASLRWAPWGKTQWRFFRAWCVARITTRVPLAVWGHGGLPLELNPCPLCSARSADLAHLVGECASTTKYREEGSWASSSEVLKWCLEGAGDMADLRARVRLLGLSVSAAVAAMSSRTPTDQESGSVQGVSDAAFLRQWLGE